jgi:amino acid adenylation domain-containing protein
MQTYRKILFTLGGRVCVDSVPRNNNVSLWEVAGPVVSDRLIAAFKSLLESGLGMNSEFFDGSIKYDISDAVGRPLTAVARTLGITASTPEEESLFSLTVFCKEMDSSYIVISTKEMVADAILHQALIGEWVKLYNDILGSNKDSYVCCRPVFTFVASGVPIARGLDNCVEFWLNEINSTQLELDLPFVDYDGLDLSNIGNQVMLSLQKKLVEALGGTAMTLSLSLESIFLATLYLLIHLYGDQQELLIGIRDPTYTSATGLPGFQVARNTLQGEMLFSDVVRGVERYLTLISEIGYVPMQTVFNRELPLFKVAFEVTQSAPTHDILMNMLDLDFYVSILKDGTRIDVNFLSKPKLSFKPSLTLLADSYHNLICQFAANPNIRVADFELLSHEGQDEVLQMSVGTVIARERNDGATLCDLFEASARKFPLRTAVCADGTEISYKQLSERANQIAHFLVKLGVGRGEPVGVFMDRSIESIINLLAVLKSGGAYCPLDLNYPMDRLEGMLEDANVSVVLSSVSPAQFTSSDNKRIIVDSLNSAWDEPRTPTSVRLAGGDYAYTIFTSGTTGRPKGINCLHAGVLNLLDDFERRAYFDGDRGACWTSFSFDVSIYEIFTCILYGRTLVIAPEYVRYRGKDYFEWLKEERINSAYIPPFMVRDLYDWMQISESSSCLQRLLVGVEPIPEDILCNIKRCVPNVKIVNGYGPAESTICCTLYDVDTEPNRISSSGKTPIGRPVQNSCVYILNSYKKLLPIGGVGELYVSGVGTGEAYLNNVEQSRQRFVPNPFGKTQDILMYRTGDFGYYLPTGDIEFVGRRDSQVKLNGHRIELGEIESVIRKHEAVDSVVVGVFCHKSRGQQLIAFVTLTNLALQQRGSRSASDIKSRIYPFLKSQLPSYMVPEYYEVLEQFPLTLNGKIDRVRLLDRLHDSVLGS